MKKILSLIMTILMISLVSFTFVSCFDQGEEPEQKDPYEITHYATIVVEDYGTIELVLYGNAAPISVANFEKLANEGFYTGLTFHRIIDGFMAQGGGFTESGAYKEANEIKGEFTANGVNNPISHERGVISMARADAYNSGSSQFFIMHKKNTNLDGQYAAFGKVISGIGVVDDMCKYVEQGSNGAVSVGDRPVIKSITVTKA